MQYYGETAQEISFFFFFFGMCLQTDSHKLVTNDIRVCASFRFIFQTPPKGVSEHWRMPGGGQASGDGVLGPQPS